MGNSSSYRTLALTPVLLTAFLYWETRIPERNAALPPALWFYPNFAVLLGLAILPFGWLLSNFIAFTELWQNSYGLSPIETAVRFLPLGIATGLALALLAVFPSSKHPKQAILIGFVLLIPATALVPFARGLENYWRFLFPAWILGSFGVSLILVNCNVAIFRTTPEDRSGLTGAALNSAAVTGITSSVNEREPGDPYNGVSASFWWLLGCVVLEAAVVTVLYKERKDIRGEADSKD